MSEETDLAIVDGAMRTLAEAPLEASATDAQRAWVRARLLRRGEAERVAMAPIQIGSALGLAFASVVGLAMTLDPGGQLLQSSPLMGAIMAASFAALAVMSGLLAWRR